MNALDWLRETGEQPIRPVYAVFGDDSYLIRESIGAVARAVLPDEDREAGISRFSGPVTPLATVLDEVCTLPFFSRRRLVIVEDADPFVTKYRKDLEAYVGSPSDSGTLLLQVKQWPATTKLAQLVEKAGLAINCSGPRETRAGLVADRSSPGLGSTSSSRPMPRVSWSSWSGRRRASWRPRLKSWLSMPAIPDGSSEQTSPSWSEAGRVETIWKTLDAATTGQARVALEHLDNLLAAGEATDRPCWRR